jgi:hypothetical protein
MTSKEQSEREKSVVKVQKVKNGFVVKMEGEQFVCTILPEVFALITAHFKGVDSRACIPNASIWE